MPIGDASRRALPPVGGIYGEGARLLPDGIVRDSRHLPLAGPYRSVALESVPDHRHVADRLPLQNGGSRSSLLRIDSRPRFTENSRSTVFGYRFGVGGGRVG